MMAHRLYLNNRDKKKLLSKYKKELDEANLLHIPTGSGLTKADFTVDKDLKKPHITFSDRALGIIKELVAQCEKEIAWNGLVRFDEETNTYHVYDILIFPQIVTGASVDVDETKYANWIGSLTDDQINHMRFHGHSHVNMSTGPSGIDTGYQHEMLSMQITDYYIFMIFNKRNEMYACIYDKAHNIFYEREDIIIESPMSEWKDTAAQMIKENVESPKPKVTTNYTGNPYRGGYGNTAHEATQPMGYWGRQLLDKAHPTSTTGINRGINEADYDEYEDTSAMIRRYTE